MNNQKKQFRVVVRGHAGIACMIYKFLVTTDMAPPVNKKRKTLS